MVQKRIFYHLLVFIFILSVAGCKTTGEKEAKPDPFEKWRVMAESTKGRTPSPQNYDHFKTPEPKPKPQPALTKPMEKNLPSLPTMPVSMKMHDVDVAVLLRTLARAAGVNIMINDTVAGSAKINIDKIPWDQAFKGLLATYGLTYEWQDKILRVITVEDLNKDIAMMEARQKFEKSKKEHAIAMMAIQQEQAKLDPLVTRIIKINYADLIAMRENLETYLKAGAKDRPTNTVQTGDKENGNKPDFRGSILMDAATNSLIIQATQNEINQIIPIIAKLDRPSRQILIEAHIVEANSDTAKELGIQWGGLGLHANGDNRNWIGGPMGPFDGGLFVSDDNATDDKPAGTPIIHLPNVGSGINFPSSENAGSADWKGMTLGLMRQEIGDYLLYAQLTALEEEGKLNILSKPSITTMDHQKAIIESGQEVPFQTVEDDEVKIEWKKAVIKLEVTPHVIDPQTVWLEIMTHKDELDWTRTVAGNPTIITKNAQTRVNLFDGQTTVIGGLNKEKVMEGEAGVPWLKDIPGLGYLFRSQNNGQDMEELLIFITPHILTEGRPSGPVSVPRKKPETKSQTGTLPPVSSKDGRVKVTGKSQG
ncbi:MAG: type IV pilus secretin PilQ [Desulfobacterales bacterium]|nr:type IV pilus secretin PilQ [Desulfobacterales bacterium]